MHGFGKVVSLDGETKEGLFEDDKLIPNNEVSYDPKSKMAQQFNENDYTIPSQ